MYTPKELSAKLISRMEKYEKHYRKFSPEHKKMASHLAEAKACIYRGLAEFEQAKHS